MPFGQRGDCRLASAACDAIVLGRHGMSAVEEFFMGSVTHKVLQHAKGLPICVVHGKAAARKALVPVVSSPNSKRALENAAWLLSVSGPMEVTLLHIVESLMATEMTTTWTAPTAVPAAVEKRINIIKKQIDESDSEYDQEKLKERLAKLSGGVAVIKVGAATETELKDKKLRLEDALNATRAAVEEGIVPGGGVALLRSIQSLNKLKLEGDMQIGVDIVRRALEEPIRQIVENAGLEGSVVVNKVAGGKDAYGFNAQTEKYEDLMKAGIIDPTKVTRFALQNASSVAALLLTTEAMVAEKPKEKEDMPMMPPGGGGMGGMGGMM